MQIYPAIDLRGGQCVRLRQGDYHQETVFGDDPAAMARCWVEQGAERLHLVDLDGARESGRMQDPEQSDFAKSDGRLAERFISALMSGTCSATRQACRANGDTGRRGNASHTDRRDGRLGRSLVRPGFRWY